MRARLRTPPGPPTIIIGLATANALLAGFMAASLVFFHPTWWEGVIWLVDLWGNGGIAVALTRNYKDGLYG